MPCAVPECGAPTSGVLCHAHQRCFDVFVKTRAVQTAFREDDAAAHPTVSLSTAYISTQNIQRLLTICNDSNPVGHAVTGEHAAIYEDRVRVLTALLDAAHERELASVTAAPVLLPPSEQPGQLPMLHLPPDPASNPHWDRGYAPRGAYVPSDNGSLSAEALLPLMPPSPPAVVALRLSDLVLANDFGNAPVPVAVPPVRVKPTEQQQPSPCVPLWGDSPPPEATSECPAEQGTQIPAPLFTTPDISVDPMYDWLVAEFQQWVQLESLCDDSVAFVALYMNAAAKLPAADLVAVQRAVNAMLTEMDIPVIWSFGTRDDNAVTDVKVVSLPADATRRARLAKQLLFVVSAINQKVNGDLLRTSISIPVETDKQLVTDKWIVDTVTGRGTAASATVMLHEMHRHAALCRKQVAGAIARMRRDTDPVADCTSGACCRVSRVHSACSACTEFVDRRLREAHVSFDDKASPAFEWSCRDRLDAVLALNACTTRNVHCVCAACVDMRRFYLVFPVIARARESDFTVPVPRAVAPALAASPLTLGWNPAATLVKTLEMQPDLATMKGIVHQSLDRQREQLYCPVPACPFAADGTEKRPPTFRVLMARGFCTECHAFMRERLELFVSEHHWHPRDNVEVFEWFCSQRRQSQLDTPASALRLRQILELVKDDLGSFLPDRLAEGQARTRLVPPVVTMPPRPLHKDPQDQQQPQDYLASAAPYCAPTFEETFPPTFRQHLLDMLDGAMSNGTPSRAPFPSPEYPTPKHTKVLHEIVSAAYVRPVWQIAALAPRLANYLLYVTCADWLPLGAWLAGATGDVSDARGVLPAALHIRDLVHRAVSGHLRARGHAPLLRGQVFVAAARHERGFFLGLRAAANDNGDPLLLGHAPQLLALTLVGVDVPALVHEHYPLAQLFGLTTDTLRSLHMRYDMPDGEVPHFPVLHVPLRDGLKALGYVTLRVRASRYRPQLAYDRSRPPRGSQPTKSRRSCGPYRAGPGEDMPVHSAGVQWDPHPELRDQVTGAVSGVSGSGGAGRAGDGDTGTLSSSKTPPSPHDQTAVSPSHDEPERMARFVALSYRLTVSNGLRGPEEFVYATHFVSGLCDVQLPTPLPEPCVCFEVAPLYKGQGQTERFLLMTVHPSDLSVDDICYLAKAAEWRRTADWKKPRNHPGEEDSHALRSAFDSLVRSVGKNFLERVFDFENFRQWYKDEHEGINRLFELEFLRLLKTDAPTDPRAFFISAMNDLYSAICNGYTVWQPQQQPEIDLEITTRVRPPCATQQPGSL